MIDLLSEDYDLYKPPFIHCLSRESLDLKSVEQFCLQRGYGFYDIDIKGANSRETVLDSIAASMRFPTYFGRNWDALLDMASDLSWDKHPGYIAVIENADTLLDFRDETLGTLLKVCEAASSRWQEEEDEYGNAVKPVAFHFLFVGSRGFCHQVNTLTNVGCPTSRF